MSPKERGLKSLRSHFTGVIQQINQLHKRLQQSLVIQQLILTNQPIRPAVSPFYPQAFKFFFSSSSLCFCSCSNFIISFANFFYIYFFQPRFLSWFYIEFKHYKNCSTLSSICMLKTWRMGLNTIFSLVYVI